MSVVSFVLIAAIAAIAAYWLFPDKTEKTFEIAWRLKGWLLTILGIGFTLAFLSTGNPLLVFIGMVGVALLVWYVLFDVDFDFEVDA